MNDKNDICVIRELAEQVAGIAAKPVQEERRRLWRDHNSFIRTRPPIYMRWFACAHEVIGQDMKCEDPFWRGHESGLRQLVVQDTLEDDYIIEPWITQRASHIIPEGGPYGLPYKHIPSTEPGGAWKFDPPIKHLDDIEKLVRPSHVINEEQTARNVARLRDAVGDIIEVDIDRSPLYSAWHADLSYDLAQLRGLEQIMWDMADNPQWLHRLVGFMSESVQRVHEQAEKAGDWGLTSHENQAMPYARELPDPKPNSRAVTRDRLWCFVAAQEMAQVSPAMHDEFILRYQLPIIREFGLVAYGCCENLTHKISYLKQIPNLRRIAVTPWADVRRCAEQIGDRYVLSWRPNPSDTICCSFDPDHIRKVIRSGMGASKGCYVDITLKDIQTLQGEPDRLRRWVQIVRGVSDHYA